MMVQRVSRMVHRFWSDGPAMFMIVFSVFVLGAASQVGGVVGVAGMLIASATIAFFIWETLLKDVLHLRR